MTTTNAYIIEAFEAFVQAVQDGYAHRGDEALRAAINGDIRGARELEKVHEELMSAIGNIVEAHADPMERVRAHDTGSNLVGLLTPAVMLLSGVLEGDEFTEKGERMLAAYR